MRPDGQAPFFFPLATKITEPVAKCLPKLFSTFGVPYYIRSDAEGEFTSDRINRVCQLMKVSNGNMKGWLSISVSRTLVSGIHMAVGEIWISCRSTRIRRLTQTYGQFTG
ncbi:unnamed protein product [Sphacelaria rigidula]